MSHEDRGLVGDGPDDRAGDRDESTAEAAAELAEVLADIDLGAIEREERYASRRLASIEAGRRKAGAAGAAMAGIMLTLHEIYEGPLRDEIVAEIEASGEPGDIDTDGIAMRVDDVHIWAPPPDAVDDA
jgi:hypothetical protein